MDSHWLMAIAPVNQKPGVKILSTQHWFFNTKSSYSNQSWCQFTNVVMAVIQWTFLFRLIVGMADLVTQFGDLVGICNMGWYLIEQSHGLVQERRNSSALAMELRLSCINPSSLWYQICKLFDPFSIYLGLDFFIKDIWGLGFVVRDIFIMRKFLSDHLNLLHI